MGAQADSFSARHSEDYLSEMAEESFRNQQFPLAHPRLARFPVLGRIFRRIHSHGYPFVGAVLAVLVVFTMIKAPYLNLPFTGEHYVKYNTYVEPAVHMMERNDPFWFQQKYAADPVANPEGMRRDINYFPLYEWGLFLTYKMLPFGTIEFKTRIFAHLIGVLMLLLAYAFFRFYMAKKLALILLSLIAINPIISLATYVTNLDILAIVFMFASFIALNRYFRIRRFRDLFVSGLLLGTGISIKFSILIFVVPIGILLIWYQRRSRVEFARDAFLYTALGGLVTVGIVVTVARLLRNPIQGTAVGLAFSAVLVAIYVLLKRRAEDLDGLVRNVFERKYLAGATVLILLAVGALAYRMLEMGNYSDEFLTDRTLLWNHRLYEYMLRHQFKSYLTVNVFWLSAGGFMIWLLMRRSDVKNLILSFGIGSAIFWIVASKSIFLHNYYTIIIMITFSMLSALFLYCVVMNLSRASMKIIVLGTFAVLIMPRGFEATAEQLGRYEDVSEVTRYVNSHTAEGDFVLFEGGALTSLSITTGRGLVYPTAMVCDQVREEIRKNGFAKTMEKYRVRFFLTSYDNPHFVDFAPLFKDTKIKEPGFNRNKFIFDRIGYHDPAIGEAYLELDDVVRDQDIPSKFRMDGRVGKYRVYSFSH